MASAHNPSASIPIEAVPPTSAVPAVVQSPAVPRKALTVEDLARETGGTYVDVEDADALAKKIARVERRQPRVLRSEYWDSPLLFAAFLLAVAGEGFLRRWNHLV